MRGVCGGFDGYPHIWLLMEDFTGIDGMCGNQESGQSCCAAATLSISRGLMVEGKVSQAQPDQQLGQHLTLHWSAINLMKHLGLAHFFVCAYYQVYISISQWNCTWFVLLFSLVRVIEVPIPVQISLEFFCCKIQRARFTSLGSSETPILVA